MTIAIVTGASRGIGRAIALQLADDGMDVAINDIQPQLSLLEGVKAEIKKKGAMIHQAFAHARRQSICVIADVSKEAEVVNMVETTVKHFGELNVMIANAGIIIPKRLFEVSVAEWDQIMEVNVRGVFLCYREAGRQMAAQGKGGKIVGACSVAGYRPSGNAIAYSVSKWAVRGLTQTTALELAEHNINMWDKIGASIEARDGTPKDVAFKQSVLARAALKRPQEPEDLANAVSFLVSEKARQITGQSIIVDGGIVFS